MSPCLSASNRHISLVRGLAALLIHWKGMREPVNGISGRTDSHALSFYASVKGELRPTPIV